MAEVRFEAVSKRYGGLSVVDAVDIAVQDGEFAVFVGPSGCGKSTLLRMLAGLDDVTEGTIRIGGRAVNALPPRARDVAMVFQNYALYPHMTVAQNIGFPLRMIGMDRAERNRRVAEAAALLELTAFLDRYPRQLSGGQRQRVAMGRALVRAPEVFLFDEPLSNLDAALRLQMRLEIARLHREIAATMIYVTHDQVEAMTLADRIVVLRDGRVEQQGTPREVYTAPRTRFVAGFIGAPQMNFLDVALGPGPGGGMVARAGTALALALRPEGPVAAGARASLGLRPEALRPGDGGPVVLAVRVVHTEYLGAALYLHLLPEGLPDARPMVMAADPDRPASPGTRMAISFSPEAVHLFDAEGLRLPAQAAALR